VSNTKDKNKNISSNLSLGVSLMLLGLLLFIGRINTKETLSSSFQNEPVTINDINLDSQEEGDEPKRIIIPSVEIDLPVNKSKIIDGYWEVFENSAGWGEGSGFPDQLGNQVIFAHAKENLFLPLQSIKVDDKIYILTQENHYSYQVKEIKEVYPNQTEVIASTEDETLTLYTCSGYSDSKRLIIVAKRI
jgi:LPXTG-site transpeptidase (sortase) family protein